MTNSQYKSLGSVIWAVLKNPLASELTYEEAAEYSLECIKLLGAPVIYINKLHKVDLLSHKAELPCDLLYIEGVEYFDGQTNEPIAMREASNIYHLDPEEFTNSNSQTHHNRNEFTYKIQNGIIFTSMSDGCIQISYKAIATDEEGYPLIPDNQKVQLALEYYILSRYLEPLWMMGKITDKAFEYIQQKRYFYVPSAYTSLTMPGIDKMETMMNTINRLIVNTTAHQNKFKKSGEKERLKKYR
jgi:hypothetical protein